MPQDLSKLLVIAVTSRALFDLSKENSIFEEQGLEAYSRYQLEHEDDILDPGAAFPLVQAFLRLNDLAGGERKVDVIVLSRNSADISLRIFNSIRVHNLDISRAALTSGAPVAPYLGAFSVDLFLSADDTDVGMAIDSGFAAGRIYDLPKDMATSVDQIRVAFDADAVLFSGEAEEVYRDLGLDAFHQYEMEHAHDPLPEGPFARLLKTLSFLQFGLHLENPPIRIAIVTSRSTPAHERVIRTLREWGVRVDEAFFMGGASKSEVLRAFAPHIFFDDQDINCIPASKIVPTARVPLKKFRPKSDLVQALLFEALEDEPSLAEHR